MHLLHVEREQICVEILRISSFWVSRFISLTHLCALCACALTHPLLAAGADAEKREGKSFSSSSNRFMCWENASVLDMRGIPQRQPEHPRSFLFFSRADQGEGSMHDGEGEGG